ncbi:glutamine synthetase family protein [Streptomyces sp. NPDC048324]|uniref:glutamine synthetase family protein n=1 Tax=Streptomyces sp. NPDC048324 TaxID=3157205 RepID=UPI00341CC414
MAAPSSNNGSVARPATTSTPAPRGRSEGQLSITDLRNLVKAGRIQTVLLALPDLQGRLKGKWYDAQHFLKNIAHGGAEFCAYVLATDVDMSPVSGFALASWETGYQDLAVSPALSTLRTLPWMEGTAVVLGDAVHHDGTPIAVAPRQILQAQMTRLAAHGLHVKAGLETEFVLYQGTYEEAADAGYQGLRPLAAENLDYALDHSPAAARFFRRLQRALAGTGLPMEAIKTEGAPGQVEVTFPYGGALTACDGHLLFKHAVRALGARAGLAPTFMAAPETGVQNGLHLHVSLWKNGISQFKEPGGGLSQIARQAIAGLVDTFPELALLYAPNVNSYKRFVPGSFAPTTMSWGYDNRTCAVRVVGHDEGLHLEIRVPGADANPYLALSAVLATIDHGIEQQLTPGAAETSNAYNTGGTAVPPTLQQALAAFQHSAIAEKAFSADVVEHYAHLAQLEIDHHHRLVTDAERHRWLARA